MSPAERLLAARSDLYRCPDEAPVKAADEGGCGVTGFASTVPVGGKFIYEPSIQMQNRGNGKGGGIAAVGFVPEQIGVSRDVLDSHYILQVALLDAAAHEDLERKYILPNFDIALSQRVETIGDYRDIPGLEVRPPDVHRYIARVKPDSLRYFARATELESLSPRDLEDEFVYRNSFRINDTYYASLGEKRAFVLSHGRDLMVFKLVGFAEQNVQYYNLADTQAHVWIAHQRYPTKGRVWHPGGAHPFVGVNEALVHNGDFANYHSVCEYLRQRNIRQQFLTDTEVSVQLFDLWDRVYKYPLEYIIEALAPTTEMDFDRLSPEKQRVYRQIQAAHIHASPDGPWFFIIARSHPDQRRFQLMGITDTSMLRPQVFALSDSGDAQIALVCSEKQAIDATLRSLAREDRRFCPVADKYWNARGGSHTDGGAFIFTVERPAGHGPNTLTCTDKFGREVILDVGSVRCDTASIEEVPNLPDISEQLEGHFLHIGGAEKLFEEVLSLPSWSPGGLHAFCGAICKTARSGKDRATAIEALTMMYDRRFDTGDKRRSTVLQVIEEALGRVFDSVPLFGQPAVGYCRRIDWATRGMLRAPAGDEELLVLDAEKFPPEGDDCDAVLLREAYKLGWKRIAVCRLRGQRFHGAGLGADTGDLRIDLYGSSGDYIASGADGLTMHVHGNAQDQVGQILKAGKLVIHGDVGQTFMYGAKGGDVYVLGNAAGRPLINAVGRPRVVINGTCLDFLAESFMAGDPLNGGGFVILNGMGFDGRGRVVPLDAPYPGSNLFSLASGGAIYVRDPAKQLVQSQLNGGEFVDVTDMDWRLIRGYLEENERLFGITVRCLLTVDGQIRRPAEVYRKIQAVKLAVLAAAKEDDEE